MRILVVEDEHRIATTIKKGLEQERFAVDVSYSGTAGFDLASTEDYELIILDLMLPGMDGLTFCKNLRKKQIHTPIIMLTAKSQIEDKVQGLDNGADDYITKPFSFEELLARIRAVIRRPKKMLNLLLTVSGLTLDPKNFIVARDHKPIKLSTKEFALLEYLIRHKNTIISKQEIINHVWDYDSNILPNTVEVFIKNLRVKIDKPFKPKKPLIQTMRGFGYRIG